MKGILRGARTWRVSWKVAGQAVIVLGLLALLVPGGWGQDSQATAAEPKVEKEFYAAKDRQEAVRKASLFAAKAVGDVDVLAGPKQKKKEFQFHPNDKVICDFDKPGSQMGGKTPKFACKITRVESANGQVQADGVEDEAVKVKFGAKDNELYAEVAASRLLWALGYYADAWFAVRVECHNCPADPVSGSGEKATRMFEAAAVVRKADGHKMYEVGKEDEGWSWKELDTLNGRPTYERDGLKLMGAFLQHSDNKPPQQRLVCDGVKVDQSTKPFTTTCEESRMIVQDVGATFGGGGLFTSNDSAKMNLGQWSRKKMWKKTGTASMAEADCPVCQAQLKKSLTAKDGLSDPAISEEGRRFAAGLLCQLSDEQIADLFKAARVAEKPEYHNSDGTFKNGMSEESIVKQWVEAFKKKREEVASGRCRWNSKPADFAAIDNPAGLATVPNHCTAAIH